MDNPCSHVVVTIRYLHITGDNGAPAAPAVPTVKSTKAPKALRQPAAALDAATSAEISNIPGSLVCRHFARGHCSIGATCRFAHIRGDASTPTAMKRKASDPAVTAAAPVVVAAKRPCQFFASGLCKRGEQCAYSHDLPTPPATQPTAKKEKKAKATASVAGPVKAAPVATSAVSVSVSLDRTCIECETPGAACWQCAKCDDSLYCDACNELVHKSKVMKSHERVKLAAIEEKAKNPTCDECEESESSVMCEQCEVVLCADCDASVHKFKSLRSHRRTELVKSTTPAAAVETAKPVVQEPVLKKQKVVKAEVVAARAPVAPEIAYIESVPKYDLTSESESESSDDEAEPDQQQQQNQEEDESMDSDDSDELPIVANAFPPQSVTNVGAAVAQKRQVAVAKPVAPAPVVHNGDISSESSDDEDERPVVLAAPVVRKAPVAAKPVAASPVTSVVNLHEVSSDSESSSDDDVKPKSAPITTTSKPIAAADSSSSSDEASSSEDDDDKPVVKAKAPAPSVVKKAPAPSAPKVTYSGSVNPGISTGSSHSLVKKIEAYAESGATEMVHLDANLNGFERLLAHDCAERLGLQHVSVGEGLERHITICRR